MDVNQGPTSNGDNCAIPTSLPCFSLNGPRLYLNVPSKVHQHFPLRPRSHPEHPEHPGLLPCGFRGRPPGLCHLLVSLLLRRCPDRSSTCTCSENKVAQKDLQWAPSRSSSSEAIALTIQSLFINFILPLALVELHLFLVF